MTGGWSGRARDGQGGGGRLPRSGWGAVPLLAGCGNDEGPGCAAKGRPAGRGQGRGRAPGPGQAGQPGPERHHRDQQLKAVADYKARVVAEADTLVADTSKFTDAVRAATWPRPRSSSRPAGCAWSASS